jgi:hypothetical protein
LRTQSNAARTGVPLQFARCDATAAEREAFDAAALFVPTPFLHQLPVRTAQTSTFARARGRDYRGRNAARAFEH